MKDHSAEFLGISILLNNIYSFSHFSNTVFKKLHNMLYRGGIL